MSSDESKKTEPHLKLGARLGDAFDPKLAKLNLGGGLSADKLFGVSPEHSDIGKLAKAFAPIDSDVVGKLFESHTPNTDKALEQLGLAGNFSLTSIANEQYKSDIQKLKKSNSQLSQENADLAEEAQRLNEDLLTYKEQISIYEAKDQQIENLISRLKESGKLSEDELKELNASEDEIERLEIARDRAIEEEKETITEAIFQITESMKSLKSSMILYSSLLISASIIAVALLVSLLWGIFFGMKVDVSQINGLIANYLAFASPSILKIILLVIVVRFINNILKLRENLLSETSYIEKISGVLKASMLMSDYSRSMIEAREIFKKVTNQLIKKDGILDKDKGKEEDDAMVTSIAEKAITLISKNAK